MKIVYLHQYFNTPNMSGGTRSYEIARYLVGVGHEVHIVTSDRNLSKEKNKKWYKTNEAGIHVHWLPIQYSNEFSYRNRIKAFFKFAIKAAFKATSLGGDVVFATSTPLTIALPGIYASKRNRIPMAFEVRDLWPELPIAVGAITNPVLIWLSQQLEKFAYHSSSQIVALSPGMKEGIVKRGYPSENVTVIPNICDLELFNVLPDQGYTFRSKHSWLGNKPLVVYAGTIGFINGIEFLAYLAKEVCLIDPEIRFLVVGTGREEQKIRKIAEALGILEKNFFMIQKVAKIEMPKILSAADIAISLFINIKEMWSNSANKFFDALASGTPIAINYRGWQANLLHRTGAGIVLEVNNISNAAKELSKVIRDKKWLEQASFIALNLAREKFSRDILSKQLEKVLVEAVKKRQCQIR